MVSSIITRQHSLLHQTLIFWIKVLSSSNSLIGMIITLTSLPHQTAILWIKLLSSPSSLIRMIITCMLSRLSRIERLVFWILLKQLLKHYLLLPFFRHSLRKLSPLCLFFRLLRNIYQYRIFRK